MAYTTGTGQGGKSLNDRKLAADVRTLTLRQIKKYLEDDSQENDNYRKQLLLKLANTVLPRLNEHTGADGEQLTVQILSFDANSSTAAQLQGTDGVSEEVPSE